MGRHYDQSGYYGNRGDAQGYDDQRGRHQHQQHQQRNEKTYGREYGKITYWGALAAFVAMACAVIALSLPYWQIVKTDDVGTTSYKDVYSGLWSKCQGTGGLKDCATWEKIYDAINEAETNADVKDITLPDWMWVVRVLMMIGMVGAFVLAAIYGSVYLRRLHQDEIIQHFYIAVPLSVATAIVLLVALTVYGAKWKEGQPDEEIDGISNNLYACFYLSIVAVVASIAVTFTSYRDYTARSGKSFSIPFVGSGVYFTDNLYWAVALGVLMVLLAIVSIGLPLWYKVSNDNEVFTDSHGSFQ